jgi:hypothetical protein
MVRVGILEGEREGEISRMGHAGSIVAQGTRVGASDIDLGLVLRVRSLRVAYLLQDYRWENYRTIPFRLSA